MHQKSNDVHSVIITVKPFETENECHKKSSDGDNVTVNPFESEPGKYIAGIQQEFSRILRVIASLGERNAAAFETMNKKLDVLVTKQESLIGKLNALAKAVGVDINDQKFSK